VQNHRTLHVEIRFSYINTISARTHVYCTKACQGGETVVKIVLAVRRFPSCSTVLSANAQREMIRAYNTRAAVSLLVLSSFLRGADRELVGPVSAN
jgi:hypothetical protein